MDTQYFQQYIHLNCHFWEGNASHCDQCFYFEMLSDKRTVLFYTLSETSQMIDGKFQRIRCLSVFCRSQWASGIHCLRKLCEAVVHAQVRTQVWLKLLLQCTEHISMDALWRLIQRRVNKWVFSVVFYSRGSLFLNVPSFIGFKHFVHLTINRDQTSVNHSFVARTRRA